MGKIGIKGLHGPPETGPLAEMTPDQTEGLLPRAVLDDLKEGGGSRPLSTPTRSRCGLARGLREATGLPTSTIARFPDIPRGTCCCHLARAVRDRGARVRGAVRNAFERCGRRGYRAVWAQLRRDGVRVSEEAVRRAVREPGLSPRGAPEPAAARGRLPRLPRRGPQRAAGHRHHGVQAAPRVEVPPVARHRLPRRQAGGPVDRGAPHGAARQPLARGGVRDPGASSGAPAVHGDRGGHHRRPGRIAICGRAGPTRSMSRKGMSRGNARAEGLFGPLKQELSYAADWEGASRDDFMRELDGWMRRFREGRISRALGRLTPDGHRAATGYAV